jgi:hypothetical protein
MNNYHQLKQLKEAGVITEKEFDKEIEDLIEKAKNKEVNVEPSVSPPSISTPPKPTPKTIAVEKYDGDISPGVLVGSIIFALNYIVTHDQLDIRDTFFVWGYNTGCALFIFGIPTLIAYLYHGGKFDVRTFNNTAYITSAFIGIFMIFPKIAFYL